MALVDPVVFISSTMLDLEDYRQEAMNIIKRRDLKYYSQEEFVDDGSRNNATTFSEQRMEERGCNWFLGIVAFRQGYISDGDTKGVTEKEHDHALELQARGVYDRVFIMIARDIKDFSNHGAIFDKADVFDSNKNFQNLEHFDSFRNELKKRVCTEFTSLDDFRSKLKKIMEENWDSTRIEHVGALISNEPDLFGLALDIHSVSDETRSILDKVTVHKDLHDVVHTFRQNVMVPIDSTLSDLADSKYGDSVDPDSYLDYDYELKNVLQKVEDFSGSEDNTSSIAVRRELMTLKEKSSLFRDVFKSPEHAVSDVFVQDLSAMGEAIESIFKKLNYGLKENADELKDPAAKVVRMLRTPVTNGEVIVENIETRDAWLEELDRIEASSNALIDAVTVHDQWQYWHEVMLDADTLRRELEFTTDVRSTDPVLIMASCEFLNTLEYNLCNPDKTSKQHDLTVMLSRKMSSDVNKLQENSRIEGALQSINRGDRKSLQLAYKNLLAEYKSCPYIQLEPMDVDCIDISSGSSLMRVVEAYREFRKTFDRVFYEVDVELKKRCQHANKRVKKLLNLLVDLKKRSNTQAT